MPSITDNKNTRLLSLAITCTMVTIMLIGCRRTTPQPNNDHRVEPTETQTSAPAESNYATISASDTGPDRRPVDPNSGLEQETRAVWSTAGRAATKSVVDELVAKVDAAHLNVILLEVYRNGTVFFEPSHTRFPDSDERLVNYSVFKEDGYNDALSYLLALRDERQSDDDPFNDFQVHAWIEVVKGGDMEKGWPPLDKTEPHMLNALFPEFKLKYSAYYYRKDERFVRHTTSVVHQPRFRAYMVDLIAGLVEDYDIDGVHLDYIRTDGICFNNEALDYPGTAYDYPGCQQDYKAWTLENLGREYTLWDDVDGHREISDGGSGRVAAWQENAVGMLVKSIHDEVKAVNPQVIISVASVRNNPTPEARKQEINGQVAWEWLDKGWIDAVFVTAYSTDTQTIVGKIQRFKDATERESSRSRVFPGLATFTIGERDDAWSDLIVQQVDALLRRQWTGQPLEPPAKGLALFRARNLGEEAIKALAEGPFKEHATPFWGY